MGGWLEGWRSFDEWTHHSSQMYTHTPYSGFPNGVAYEKLFLGHRIPDLGGSDLEELALVTLLKDRVPENAG